MNNSFENKMTTLAIAIFALVITALCIYFNSTHNILGHSYRDVFFYLIGALRFSGVEIGGYKHINYLPPLIPFLTSILFRLGFVSESSIFITTGLFYFVGIMGMFYILKLKFNNFYAFFGAFLYATLSINLTWVANGTLDISFIALVIWALYFFIQGVESNQKYFYLAFPLGILSFFTKYLGGLVFAIMILYFLAKPDILGNIKKHFKNIAGGIIAGALTALPFFTYYFIYNIPLGFLNQAGEVSSKTSTAATHNGKLVGNDLFFYIKGLTSYISSERMIVSLIVLIIAGIGICIAIYLFQDKLRDSFKKIKDDSINVFRWKFNAKLFYLLFFVSVLIILVSFFTASLFSFIYSEILVFAGMFLFSYSLNKIILKSDSVDNISDSSFPFIAFNISMFAIFMAYLIFFSAHLVKADRYFTSMAPGFVFILIFGFESLITNIKGFKVKKYNLKYAIVLIVILIMLYVPVVHFDAISDDSLVSCEKNAGSWISDKEGVVLAERGCAYTWYLQKEMPSTRESNSVLLDEELLENNATWYIGLEDVNLTHYSKVKEFGKVSIYQRI